MRFLKSLELYFRQKRNKKYDTSDLDDFLTTEMNISNLQKKISYQDPTQKSSTIVYSTYCGSNKNKTFNAKLIQSDIDHVFISNNEDILLNAEKMGWHSCHINLPVHDNLIYSAYQAKIAKVIPHIFPFMERYDFSMYLDDKLNFDTSNLKEFQQLVIQRNSALAIRVHDFLQPTILHEFGEAMRHKRYLALRDRTIEYILEKSKAGYSLNPEKIFWTSAIFRNHKHQQIKEINEHWYTDVQQCGINCQISFDFIAQKYPIAVMPMKID
jgi:hypothetical protein